MKLLKSRRLLLGLSQQAVAKGSSISQPHYSLIEKGIRKPSYDTMERIAATLNAKVSDLFFEDDCCLKQQVDFRIIFKSTKFFS